VSFDLIKGGAKVPRLNLKKQVVVDDNKGNPQGFGPGETDVPQWAIDRLEKQGRDIKQYVVKSESPKASANAQAADKPAQP
jgi:hypothetical protein